jgi:hypothetical protein
MPVFFDISKEKFNQFQTLLSHKNDHAIVYLSDNEVFVTEVLANISKRENSSNVLYCLQKLSQFEFTELLYLNDLQTHYAEAFFVDHQREDVKNFELLFFETYQTIPDQYAYVGYDVVRYVLQLLKLGNSNYERYLETMPYQGFHNTVRLYRQDSTQGLENHETNILKIQSSQLIKVNN